jgi:GNAT superfamily N-acetyltransferase
MGDVRVRPVHPGDGPGCAGAWMDAGRHYTAIDAEQFQIPTQDGLVDWFGRLHANLAPDRLVLVACVQQDVAGFVSAVLNSPQPDAHWELIRHLGQPRVFVEALVVAERYRRQGIGTALMKETERWARQEGATSVSLRTNLRSPLSMPFYEERMGTRATEQYSGRGSAHKRPKSTTRFPASISRRVRLLVRLEGQVQSLRCHGRSMPIVDRCGKSRVCPRPTQLAGRAGRRWYRPLQQSWSLGPEMGLEHSAALLELPLCQLV